MPVSGEVLELNAKLETAPESVNSDPYNEGWMIKVKMSDASEFESLMSAEDYQAEVGA